MRSWIRRTSAIAESLAWRQARRAANASSTDSTSSMSRTSFGENFFTTAPRAATSSIRPSLARNLSASRSGVRDTPSVWQRWVSLTRVPGASTPSMIMSRMRVTTSSCRLRRAMGNAPSLGLAAGIEVSMGVPG